MAGKGYSGRAALAMGCYPAYEAAQSGGIKAQC